ncbi:MAG: ethanolamine ammonia-lyase reactivating factor EutA, partial [Chloroflexota bacterium]
EVTADDIAASIQDALTRADITEGEQPIALTFEIPGKDANEPFVAAVADGIQAALPRTISGAASLVIVVNQGASNRFVTPDQDFHVLREQHPASRLGRRLKEDLGAACEIVAVEGVHLSEFDFIDVGQMMHPSEVIPVTVKSLLFAGGMDRRSVKQALIDAALGR